VKRRLALLTAFAILGVAILGAPKANAVVKTGAKCTKLNQKVTTSSRSIYQCKRSGKVLVWKYVGKAPKPSPYLWREEFNSPVGTSPDAERWTALIGNGFDQLGLWAYGTGELEQNSPDAAATDGLGNLVITASKTDGVWTSARYWTQGNVNFQYGKIEARIKMPAGSFNWPAFWMLGSNYAPPNWTFGSKGWPMCGEIDIIEGLRSNSEYSSTIHGNEKGSERPWNWGGGLSAPANIYDSSSVYHTYGMIWKPNSITFIVDGNEIVRNYKVGNNIVQTIGGIEFNRFNSAGVWPFNQPFFLIMNNAIHKDAPDVANGTTSKMYIDWIRYSKYQGYGKVSK